MISTTVWKEEYNKRLEICKKSPRLQLIATELTQFEVEDRRAKIQRKRWPGAPYLSFVDSRFHWRLLAMTRLGILPIEIETGRWHGILREQRQCSLGCDHIGDTAQFLHGCEHITTERVSSLNRYESTHDAAKNPLRYWRNIARRLGMSIERTHTQVATRNFGATSPSRHT